MRMFCMSSRDLTFIYSDRCPSASTVTRQVIQVKTTTVSHINNKKCIKSQTRTSKGGLSRWLNWSGHSMPYAEPVNDPMFKSWPDYTSH